ncbi:flagellar basal body-associated FliL family protein [Hyphomicrobium sp.]|uniref:flagellar basal body-associated FliL family protein n=1 Tax=Hyphomicrobium sp. TaxID=82 RepID=UPI0025BFF66F|nr:flagellar basal body-associated FliL family protein [Hyphomicrobium sp.]MCC7251473.1 flagellar basal body-associated FliL family protein [Hyphomicrobium sp.]
MASADARGDEKSGGGLIGLVVVTLLALGFGAGFGFVVSTQPQSAVEAEAGGKEKAAKAEKPPAPSVSPTAVLVAMTPIVANLAEPHDAWIRIEASMLVDGVMQGVDLLAAQVAEDFVAYLRTATLSQFEGPSGFQNLREDLVDRATIRDREHIKDVIIHGVVVE